MSTTTPRRRPQRPAKPALPALLPCPHCGGPARFMKLWTCSVDAMAKGHPHNADLSALGLPEGRVACEACHARSATATKPQAIALWNRRTPA